MVTGTQAPPALRQRFGDEVNELVWLAEERAALEARWERARAMVLSGSVRGDSVIGEQANVDSSGGIGVYHVDLSAEAARHGRGCECPDYHQRAPWGWCKHKLAAWIVYRLTDTQKARIAQVRQAVS